MHYHGVVPGGLVCYARKDGVFCREAEQSWAVTWVFARLEPVHLLKVIGLHPHLNMPVARVSYIRHVIIEVLTFGLATGEQHTHRQVTTRI